MISRFCFFRRLLILAALACQGFIASPGWSQPAGADGDDFLYRVVAGDTLIDLSQRYTDGPHNWPTLQSLNAVADPALLPIGRVLRIPFSLIPEVPSQARVTHVAGKVDLNGKPLQINDQAGENDVVTSGADGFATLMLADDSTLTIPAQSSLSIERLRVFKGTGLTDTIFVMERGSLESEVAPADTGVGRFEVRTPVSITGVRGTRLRVHARENGAQSEVLSGSARLGAGAGQGATLRQGQGAAVDPDGKLLGVRPLLPAPLLPQSAPDQSGNALSFPPVPGAHAYLVRVAADPAGARLFSSRQFSVPTVQYSAPGPGTHYLLVRAIDADGVAGADAVMSFEGRAVLKTSDGGAVSTGFGQFVLLSY